jgi:putative DNA primase/helicase
VLYVEGEMAAVDLQDRLRAVRGGLPLTPAKGYFTAIFADQLERVRGVPDLSKPEGQAWLAPQIGDAEVIVIDSITTLMPTQDQNEGHDWASTQVWLLELRRRGISVIMIHHNNKSGAQNGTERRMVPLDTAIDLSQPPGYRGSEGARFIVEYIKNRGFSGADAEPFELTYRVDAGAARWVRGPVRSAETSAREALKTRIEELVAEHKSYRDIADELGISIGKVQRTLKNGAISDTEH